VTARIRAAREARGWSQQELADRAGVTRQLVGAVESGRHAPNVTAALGLARALGATVEELFEPVPAHGPAQAVEGRAPAGGPVWAATVGDRTVVVPVDPVAASERWAFADGTIAGGSLHLLAGAEPAALVVAGCDPLLGLLAAATERRRGHRIVVAHASTGAALAALAAGTVHGAVVHGVPGDLAVAPVPVRRFRVAAWAVGLASGRRAGPPTVEELAERSIRVVQREEAAGSQRSLRRALAAVGASTSLPGPLGSGHVDVARRVAQGATAGVTMEAAARTFDLGFRPLEAHAVELWIADSWATLPAAVSLVEALSSPEVLERARLLGGYDLAGAGEERPRG
jgi:DNA-binding XRE family transcriptional regulator/molybdate-binding protein